jgi:uncharacterized membrane protein YraQ (UPF0718 family)
MREFATIFLALIFETTPFLLAGVAVSVVAGPVVERALSSAAMRSPAAGAIAGTAAGVVLPMCDCGSRPLAHRLALAGRREFAIAFMVAAPVVNPIVIVTTWLAFRNVELVVLRLGITVLMALAAAVVLARLRSDVAVPIPGEVDPHEHGISGAGSWAARILDEFFELFKFLVVGSALAAFVQLYLNKDVLTSAEGVYLSVAAMMALAFLLSICSSVDAFVVAGLGSALGLGPVLAFLTFGPLVNLKSVPMYLRLFSIPAVAMLVIVVTQVAFVSSAVVELRAW